MADTNFNDPTGLIDGIKQVTEQLKFGAKSLSVAFQNMETGALAINKQFGQSRQRITELKLAVADATPVVDRLGGSITEAIETTKAISEATRRNVVASTEDISKLYAAGQILETGVKDIVESFQDVGFQFSQVGEQLEDSLEYIQSVGVNAGQVMGKVMENMSQMNRFNFQDGVQGLTRMATQATLLKFDMGQVFTLADKALDPQGAIELSSAFQRLGLAAGGLTDPFELMYKSLNDPEGLQNSLVEMTKQFTFFDEKTKSFKINPAGMLQLRELQNQTGISAAEMSKLALNTADLDRKLSMLKPSLKFENEEDKMYLANIAKMDKYGEYTVKYVDDAGQEHQEKLENLTQDQLEFLIQQEKDKPKDLEEIQRRQLTNVEAIGGDLRAIRDKLIYGTASAPTANLLSEDLGAITKIATDSLNKSVSQENIRSTVNAGIGSITEIAKKMARGENTNFDFEKLKEMSKGAFDIETLKEKLMSKMGDIKKDIPQRVKNRYDLGSVDLSKMMEKMYNWFDSHDTQKYSVTEDTYYNPKNKNQKYPIQEDTYYNPKNKSPKYSIQEDAYFNPQNKKGLTVTKIDADSINVGDKGLTELLQSIANKQIVATPVSIPKSNVSQQQPTTTNPYAVNTTNKHTFDGTITWKIDAPPELDTKRFYAMIEKQEFKDMFYKIVFEKLNETEQRPLTKNA